MDSSNAEQAYRRYSHRLGVPKPIRGTQDWNDERVAFMAAWSARDAEVEALREQLAAAEAVIEKVRVLVNEPGGYFYRDVIEAFNAAPSSVLAAHDREVAAQERDAALREAEAAVARIKTANLTSYYGIQDWIAGRSSAVRAIAALRSGTEGSGS